MPVLIQLPLDIPEVEVLSTEFRQDGDLLIKVESTRQGACCSQCGREIHHFHGYDRPLQLRHLPLLERRVGCVALISFERGCASLARL